MEVQEFGNNGDPQSRSRFHHETPQIHCSISHQRPSCCQKLICNGKLLVEEMTLRASEITNGSKMMLIASQGSRQGVSQLGAAAQKYQAATQNASSNISVPEMQNNCNMKLWILIIKAKKTNKLYLQCLLRSIMAGKHLL